MKTLENTVIERFFPSYFELSALKLDIEERKREREKLETRWGHIHRHSQRIPKADIVKVTLLESRNKFSLSRGRRTSGEFNYMVLTSRTYLLRIETNKRTNERTLETALKRSRLYKLLLSWNIADTEKTAYIIVCMYARIYTHSHTYTRTHACTHTNIHEWRYNTERKGRYHKRKSRVDI